MATQPEPRPDWIEPLFPEQAPISPNEPVQPARPDETPPLPPDIDEPSPSER
mgnify:CR=1 FL=1